MARDKYWHQRFERWGAWQSGSRGVSVAPWARMRNGTPMAHADDMVPELHEEERETDLLVSAMPKDLQTFARMAYPGRARLAATLGCNKQTLQERYGVLHRTAGRLLDQRRKGEKLDPGARRGRMRITRTSHAATQG